ncbi:MAG: LLM class F420-dependent oxidoreductase [Dehalococcoidia bacterium]|nr:LLM class F420-dependent oxidoreductase [Dehalococcoidia bacterium]
MTLQFGAHFPNFEIGNDPAGITAYAQGLEAAGYDYLETYDHVLGVDRNRPPRGFRGAHDSDDPFHEPFVMFAYLAALTQRLVFSTGSLILPQRQTALVAKQAAELAILSGGRFRLGVGIGWNPSEYRALNEDFTTRGRRMEEQVALLRQLWAEPTLNFEGRFHRVPYAGINPRPAQPIPIWMGGGADPVIDRIGRLADGWIIPTYEDAERMKQQIPRIREIAEAAGRDSSTMGFSVVIRTSDGTRTAVERALEWEEAGVTHVAVGTAGNNHLSIDRHHETLRGFIEEYHSFC